MLRRDFLKNLAESPHPERVGVYQSVVDDDEVTLAATQENAYRKAQEDDDLFVGSVTQTFQGQRLIIPGVLNLNREEGCIHPDRII